MSEILSALEDKIRIPARQCNILYVFRATRCVFSFAFAGLMSTGKRRLPWVQACFDPTAVHNRMPHDMFADCDLSPRCPAHSFTVLPLLLSEPTKHKVSREDSVAK